MAAGAGATAAAISSPVAPTTAFRAALLSTAIAVKRCTTTRGGNRCLGHHRNGQRRSTPLIAPVLSSPTPPTAAAVDATAAATVTYPIVTILACRGHPAADDPVPNPLV